MANPFDFGGLLANNDPMGPIVGAQQANADPFAALNAPSTGFIMNSPPLVKQADPDIRKAIFNAGIGILKSNTPGADVGQVIAGGLQGYQSGLDQGEEDARKARAEQLAQYAILGTIQQRQQAQQAAMAKLTALKKLQTDHPEMADLIAVDPEGAAKKIAETINPQPKYENVGGVLYDVTPGRKPVPVSGTGAPGAGLVDPNAVGDVVLQSIQPAQAATVKALAEGRQQFPSGAALKSPYWQQMMSLVSQYDPQFDAVNYSARAATRKAFTAGPEAKQINALNTAIGHLAGLSDKGAALHNGKYPLLNMAGNMIADAQGKPALTGYETNQKAVADEVAKVWRATGGSEADIQENLKNLSSSKSPAQMQEAFGTIGDLLRSKIESLNDQYRRGMGTAAQDKHFFTKESIDSLTKLGVTGLPDAANSEIDGTPKTAAPTQTLGPTGMNTPTGNDIKSLAQMLGQDATLTPDKVAAANASAVKGPDGQIPPVALHAPVSGDPLAPIASGPQIPADIAAAPSAEDIQALLANPEGAAVFDKHFGAGTAAEILKGAK